MKPIDTQAWAKSKLPASAVLFVIVLSVTVYGGQVEGNSESIHALIQKAGNSDSDKARLAYLKQLRNRPEIDISLKADIDKLIIQIDRWLGEKRLDYFGREVKSKKDFDFQIPESSLVYPLTWLYRGRMVIWYAMESGSVWNIAQKRREFFGTARAFFEKYVKTFGKNKIARMYLGQPIGPHKHYEAVAGAPRWAVYQREGLERLTDIIEWWIDNRMQENGEYGGGWDDDCEMWRWWVPVLIGFDSPKITLAQVRFSEALLAQPHMKPGYTTRMSDVEHTAEDSADAITPMMHIDTDNEFWRERALHITRLMEEFWTGRNERGLLQFKSTYFTANKIDTNPTRACDTVYHPRVVQPALLYWQRTGDEKLTRLFSAWMDTWVDAAARTERGKPAGILPTAIHWPDGRVGGEGPDWWDPRNHGEYTLYLYPSAMRLMTHTLLLTHYMTGQAKYLEPIRSMTRIRLEYLTSPPRNQPAPGSEAWCASKLDSLSNIIAKYRLLTGNSEFDELLSKERTAYVGFRIRGDLNSLVLALRDNAEALRVNFEGYTSEVRYTDRVLRFPSLFGENGFVPEAQARISKPDTLLLYSAVTGDPGDAGYFPLNAVRWLTPPRKIAALVTDSATDHFTAELFHFGEDKRPMSAELYLLKPGNYTLAIASKDARGQTPIATHEFTAKGLRTRISFELPSHKLCVLHVGRR